MRLAPRECEFFSVLFLDNRHRLIHCADLFRGTIDGASVHPREVVKGEPHAANDRTGRYGPARSEAGRVALRHSATTAPR